MCSRDALGDDYLMAMGSSGIKLILFFLLGGSVSGWVGHLPAIQLPELV
jgi:hypothetical protein